METSVRYEIKISKISQKSKEKAFYINLELYFSTDGKTFQMIPNFI